MSYSETEQLSNTRNQLAEFKKYDMVLRSYHKARKMKKLARKMKKLARKMKKLADAAIEKKEVGLDLNRIARYIQAK
jgi:hypothetical protein